MCPYLSLTLIASLFNINIAANKVLFKVFSKKSINKSSRILLANAFNDILYYKVPIILFLNL